MKRWTFALWTAVLMKLGRREEARTALKDLLAHAPEMSCAKYRKNPFGGPEAAWSTPCARRVCRSDGLFHCVTV
jgi:hypothetical protein